MKISPSLGRFSFGHRRNLYFDFGFDFWMKLYFHLMLPHRLNRFGQIN